MMQMRFNAGSVCLTFPEVDLEGQQVSFDLLAHQVLERDQELDCLVQRVLWLQEEVVPSLMCISEACEAPACRD